jgi:glucosylceramidase
MSVQNEPKAVQTWESCIYSGEDEGVFVTKNLKPNLKKAGFDDLKILIWDHNKERVVDRALETFAVPGAKDDIWGIGFHWYSGEHFDNLRMAHELFPDKPLILTEFCRGDNNSAPKDQSHGMPLPTWDDFEAYANELIGDFNNYTSAACDWNMIVDMNGGPYHNRTGGVKAPIFVDKDNDRYILTACYYAIGHFSKYVKPGAHRIGNSVSFRYEGKDVQLPVSTFQNPDGEIVVVILNRNNFICNPLIKIGDDTAPLSIPAKSLITVVIPPVK